MGDPGPFPERMPPNPHFASNGMPFESGVNIDGFFALLRDLWGRPS
jgi:hypothetical protein